MDATLEVNPAELEYGYLPLVAASMDDVLTRQGTATTIDSLLDLTLRTGRVLLQAPGGAGKTWTVNRLRASGAERALRLSVLTVADRQLDASSHLDVTQLLATAEPSLSWEELASQEPFVLVIDGLNEADRVVGGRILNLVEELAALAPFGGVLVTDRLVRRPIDVRRWGLATLSEISQQAIESLLGTTVTDSEAALLASPVYLALRLSADGRSSSRSESHRKYLEETLHLTSGTLDKMATQAFKAYSNRSSRLFPIADLEVAVGQEVVATLLEAVALVRVPHEGDDLVRWRHHLIHDYLAARSAAKHPATWDHRTFDVLTFQGASTDSLVMLLEEAERETRDSLVRLVYDWNVYASAYLLSEDGRSGGTVSPSTEAQVLALLGERRFDPFLVTSQQVTDALRVHGGPLASAFLELESPSEAISLAASQLDGNVEYQEWIRLFSITDPRSSSLPLGLLTHADGIYGWAAANVLRRLEFDTHVMTQLGELARSERPVVRWRTAHVLGVAGPSGLNDLRLLLSDEDVLVRYGALRSVVEQALVAEDPVERIGIFGYIAEASDQLLNEAKLVDEFERVLQVKAPPANWALAASPIIEKMLVSAATTEDQDRWRQISSDLRLVWSVA